MTLSAPERQLLRWFDPDDSCDDIPHYRHDNLSNQWIMAAIMARRGWIREIDRDHMSVTYEITGAGRAVSLEASR